MSEQPGQQARIFWYDRAEKWAIRAPTLPDNTKASQFAAAVRQQCKGVFHHGLQAWLVPEDTLATARAVVEKYYRYCQFVERAAPKERATFHHDAPRARPKRREMPAYEFFCSLVGWSDATPLSFAQAKSLYRRAACRLHPDVGGSSEKMASLNAAWQAIRDTLA